MLVYFCSWLPLFPKCLTFFRLTTNFFYVQKAISKFRLQIITSVYLYYSLKCVLVLGYRQCSCAVDIVTVKYFNAAFLCIYIDGHFKPLWVISLSIGQFLSMCFYNYYKSVIAQFLKFLKIE